MADISGVGSARKYERQMRAFRSHRNRIALILLVEFLAILPFVAVVAIVSKDGCFLPTDCFFRPHFYGVLSIWPRHRGFVIILVHAAERTSLVDSSPLLRP